MSEERVAFLFARNTVSGEELLTMKQVAEMVGTSYWYIRALSCGSEKSRIPFPKPDTKLARSPLWKKRTIQEWVEARNKKHKNAS